jgi:hypothetical protein
VNSRYSHRPCACIIKLKKYGTTGYRYVETGYSSIVECIHNSSSGFVLKPVVAGINHQLWQTPYILLATGTGPNTTMSRECAASKDLTQCGGFVTAGFFGDMNVTAAAWWASFESGNANNGLPQSTNYNNTKRPPLSKAYTALAAGENYASLDNTQCSIQMVPTSFTVDVDTLARTITVVRQSSIHNVTDIEPTGFIADSASAVLAVMSSADTTLHTSVLGDMLQRNIDNVHQRNNSASIEQATLQGVAEALQVLIDDHLLATASAQLMIAKDTVLIKATVSQEAFSIGDHTYAIATVALNALIVIIFTTEAIRTLLWSQLTRFDYEDVTSVIPAASFGMHDPQTQLSKIPASDVASRIFIMLRPYEGMTLALSSQPYWSGTARFWRRKDRTEKTGSQPAQPQPEDQDAMDVPLMKYATHIRETSE